MIGQLAIRPRNILVRHHRQHIREEGREGTLEVVEGAEQTAEPAVWRGR
jgi:hypothetical protein